MSFNAGNVSDYSIIQETITNFDPEESKLMRDMTQTLTENLLPKILQQQEGYDRLSPNERLIAKQLAKNIMQHSLTGMFEGHGIEETAQKIYKAETKAIAQLYPPKTPTKKHILRQKIRNKKTLSNCKKMNEEISGWTVSVMTQLDSSRINNIKNKILAAKQGHCHPKDLSHEKTADIKMQALLEEEAEKKAARNGKKMQGAKKTKSQTKQVSPQQGQQTQNNKKTQRDEKIPQSSSTAGTKKPTENNMTSHTQKELVSIQTTQIYNNFFKIPSCSEISHVTRWATESLNEIRLFSDTDQDGTPVFKYAEMNDEDILFQRACHYLPGTENLLMDDRFRDIYTFPTDRGYGMIAQLITDQTSLEGAIYFGTTQANNVFHKKFDVRNFDNENIFIEKTSPRFSQENHKIEEWKSQKYDFTLDVSKEGTLMFTYSNNHAVKILPIFTEKLPEIAQS